MSAVKLLRFLFALAAATLVHTVGTRLFPPFPAAADVFLVVAMLNALGGSLVGGMLGGALAGLLTDALSGGPFGLHGFADTILGYATAFAARRLVIESSAGIVVLCALGSAVQQAVVTGLMLALLPVVLIPSLPWLGLKVASSGILGLALMRLAERVAGGVRQRRLDRRSRLRVSD